MADCSICCEKLIKPVTCNYCDYTACKTCTQRYLLESVEDPHCMQCRKAWSRDFVDTNLTATFRNTKLKKHREQVLMEREKSQLPATQGAVEREKNRREATKLLGQVDEEIRAMRTKMRELERRKWDIVQNMEHGHEIIPSNDGEKKYTTRKCPSDNCKGFLDSKWHCSLCEKTTCKECHQTKDEDHECKQCDIDTAKMVEKETKPCPKCGMRIFKIMGCDQMYCTMCHTPFSWRTGQVVGGTIHNPHYYEFMRQNGGMPRANGDIPCGGLPREIWGLEIRRCKDYSVWYNRITGNHQNPRAPFRNRTIETHQLELKMSEVDKALWEKATKQFEIISDIHRLLAHMEHNELTRYRTGRDNTGRFEALRVKYMMNEIDEEKWAKELQKQEKARMKENEMGQILRMFHDIGAEQFRIIVENNRDVNMEVYKTKTIQEMKNLEKHMLEVRMYANKSMAEVAGRYKCVYPHISDKFKVKTQG